MICMKLYGPSSTRDIPVLTDDNYAVMKVKDIGVQCGADLSCFSAFKLLGPEGIGVIAGRKRYIDRLISESYSGGMQTQGHEALDVLHGLVYALWRWQSRPRWARSASTG